MLVVDPGSGLIDLVRSANDRVTIIAPYIKSRTLRTLIDVLPKSVQAFVCVTRWLPEDLASGVCDIEIFDDVASCVGGELRVHQHLHGKFYSNADRCLVGSANVTGRGLGWHAPSNVELLVELQYDFPGILEWESMLLRSSILATAELRDLLRDQAGSMRESMSFLRSSEVGNDSEHQSFWVPTCTIPDRLWMVYQGQGAESIVASAYKAAEHDLAVLAPPPGLSQVLFDAYVTVSLRQMPVISGIDSLASKGVTDLQAVEFLSERLAATDTESFEHAWRVLKSWLMHFFPETFRLETSQEMLVKGKNLTSR